MEQFGDSIVEGFSGEVGNRRGVARNLSCIGWFYFIPGKYDVALENIMQPF